MKTRILAAGTHFLFSALVIFISLNVIYFIWYPEPFYTIHSVFDAVKIVLIVDLILGPILTLIIFDTKKARYLLVRDITVILIFQISALVWGLHITYKMRPIFLVFQGDTFYPIVKSEISTNNLNPMISAPEVWESPKTVYVEPLKGAAAIQRMENIASGGEFKGEMYQAEKYKALSLVNDNDYRKNIIKQAMKYSYLIKSNNWKVGVEKLIQTEGGEIEDYLFYPVVNDLYFGLIVYSKKNFSYIGLVKGR